MSDVGRRGGIFVSLLVVFVAGWCGCKHQEEAACSAENEAAAKEEPDVVLPGSVLAEKYPELVTSNTDCLVCHPKLAEEVISVSHLEAKMGCRFCHGMSDDHMQDEMEMTTPDILFGRTQVEAYCRTCHLQHMNPEKVQEFFTKWRGKDRPNGRVIAENSICTDCHGTHNIHRGEAKVKKGEEAAFVPLFDGGSLKGWAPVGQAKWAVEKGAIVGCQGPDHAAGDLLSAAEYKDFLLAVTFRAEWPARAGIWLRYQSPDKALQTTIGESKDPVCYTGSLQKSEKTFIAVNLNKDLVARDGWNTLAIKAKGDQIEVYLNAVPVTVVRDATSDRGKIGFHIGGGEEYGKMKLTIREVQLQPIE